MDSQKDTEDLTKYLASKIERITDKLIYFGDGTRKPRVSSSLTSWVSSNLETIVSERMDLISDGLESLKKETSKSFKEVMNLKCDKRKIVVDPVKSEYTGEKKDLFDPMSLAPMLNVTATDRKNQYVMVDKTKEYQVSEMSYQSWFLAIGKETAQAITEAALIAKIVFDPRKIKSLYFGDFSGSKIHYCNQYIAPPHRTNRITNPKVPSLLMKFLKNLFINKKCFDYIMESVWYVLNDRLQVFIVMNGGTGVGKGLFTEGLMRRLVGERNAIVAPASWDKSTFNAWMGNKQFILMDEVKVQTEGPDANINYLKRINNDIQNIEKKGVDADESSRNHASFFITSNHGTKNFRLEEDSRRFAPVDITDEKFVNVYTENEQLELLDLIYKDDDAIAQLYWFVQNNYDPKVTGSRRTPLTILQCETLYRFKYESLKMWQRVIVDAVLSKERVEYTRSYLRDSFEKYSEERTGQSKRFTINREQIKEFLIDYKHRDRKEPLGQLSKDEDGEMVVVAHDDFVTKEARSHKENNFEEVL